MERRRLGSRGPALSVIGFGAWAIGGGGYEWGWSGPRDDAAATAAMHRALDLGVNWIDTAAVYGRGRSEELVARAITGMRERPFIATKCGRLWNERGEVWVDLRPASIRREVEASLRRLEVEAIDLFQGHVPDSRTPVEETWQTMAALQDEGKVVHLGLSHFGRPLIERCLKIRHVDALQLEYSPVKRSAEDDLLRFCAAQGIGVLAHSPLRSGLLSGHFDPARIGPDDWRRRLPAFQEPLVSRYLALVERLRAIAARHAKSPGQLAIAWALRQPAVTSAIVGARRPEQVEENVGGVGWQLTVQDLEDIDRAVAECLPLVRRRWRWRFWQQWFKR